MVLVVLKGLNHDVQEKMSCHIPFSRNTVFNLIIYKQNSYRINKNYFTWEQM